MNVHSKRPHPRCGHTAGSHRLFAPFRSQLHNDLAVERARSAQRQMDLEEAQRELGAARAAVASRAVEEERRRYTTMHPGATRGVGWGGKLARGPSVHTVCSHRLSVHTSQERRKNELIGLRLSLDATREELRAQMARGGVGGELATYERATVAALKEEVERQRAMRHASHGRHAAAAADVEAAGGELLAAERAAAAACAELRDNWHDAVAELPPLFTPPLFTPPLFTPPLFTPSLPPGTTPSPSCALRPSHTVCTHLLHTPSAHTVCTHLVFTPSVHRRRPSPPRTTLSATPRRPV